MRILPRRDFELNELGWWANWAKLEWVAEDAYLLSSKELPEVFYNRGGLLSCSSIASLESIEEKLGASRARPALMVFDSCRRATRILDSSGYLREDVMTVMAATGKRNDAAGVEVGRAKSAEVWAEAYLKAFYDDLGLLPTVRRIVKPLLGNGSTTLFEAKLDGEVAGTLAAYRTERMLGVYCVGTVPGFRRRGVADALLARARELALTEGRTVILQSLESDGVVTFYLRRGFRVQYRKVLMTKKG